MVAKQMQTEHQQCKIEERWGVTAVRENARLLLDRLSLVGQGSLQAAARRQDAVSDAAARARRAACAERHRR